METLSWAIVLCGVIYFISKKYSNPKRKLFVRETDDERSSSEETLPYRVSASILTNPEISFYNSLKLHVGDRAIICPKVGLKDLFFISKGVGNDYMKYFGKIAQKHVDFLLCEPKTLKPICGIELDDSSHTNEKRYERDLFFEKVFRDANFELIRISSASENSFNEIKNALSMILDKPQDSPAPQTDDDVVLCPKCNIPMVLRKATKGQNTGQEFYGCVNYPKCKEIIPK